MQNTEERKIMTCPLNGKLCVSGVREDFPKDAISGIPVPCRWWVHLYGKDPQSEKILDQNDCSIAWLPVTTIETSQGTRFTSASVDKLANAVVETKQAIAQGLHHVANGFQALGERVEELSAIQIPPNGHEQLDGPDGNGGG